MSTLNTTTVQTSSRRMKSKTTFLLMLAAFALPVILAKLALNYNWLNYGVTNKGTLIEQPVTLQQLNIDSTNFANKWLLLYHPTQHCNAICQSSMKALYNTYLALGKDKPRVLPVALLSNEQNQQYHALEQATDWHFSPATQKSTETFAQPQLLIVDPLGNIILSHQLPANESQQTVFGKQVLADMKKLLKYSKVG